MAHSSGKTLMQWQVAALLFAMLGGSLAVLLCNIESSELKLCRDAVTSENPPNPDAKCCDVVHRCNLTCLCDYKSELPLFGINSANAMALPGKCGLKKPSNC